VGLPLFRRQAVKQPSKLSTRDSYCAGAMLGPSEPTLLQPLVVQPEPIAVPVEDLDLISFPVAESKEARGERIEAEPLLHDGGQPVDGLAQIGAATRQVNLADAREV